MKITSLQSRGLKSGDFQHDLAPINIITGDNFAGKTSRLDAIRLGLIGYLPELGKTGTSELARAGEIEINLAIGKESLNRSWKTVKGAFRGTATVPQSCETPPVLMDPGVYFSLGEKERMRYIFSHVEVDAEKCGASAILDSLKAFSFSGAVIGLEKALTVELESISESDFDRHRAGQSIQDWLESLTLTYRDKLKGAKAKAESAQAAVRGLVDIQLAAEDGEDHSARLSDITQQLSGLHITSGRLRSEAREQESRKARLEAATRHLATLKDMAPEIARLEGLINDLEADKGQDAPIDSGLLTSKIIALRSEIAFEQATLANLKNELAIQEQAQAKDAKATACPHCGAKGKSWRTKIMAGHKARIVKLAEVIQETEIKLGKLVAAKTTSDAELAALLLHQEAGQRKLQAIASLNRELLAARVQHDQSAIWRAEVASLSQGPQPAVLLERLQSDAQDTVREIGRLETERLDLETKQKVFAKAQADRQAQAQAQVTLAASQVQVTVLSGAVKVLETMQARLVEQAFSGLLRIANAIIGPMLKSPLQYRDGEIGRAEGSTWIKHRTFSGVEKALAYTGISAALAHDAPVKIILMDELGRFTANNKLALLVHLERLIKAGAIDQFVGIDTDAAWARGDINIIKV